MVQGTKPSGSKVLVSQATKNPIFIGFSYCRRALSHGKGVSAGSLRSAGVPPALTTGISNQSQNEGRAQSVNAPLRRKCPPLPPNNGYPTPPRTRRLTPQSFCYPDSAEETLANARRIPE